MYFKKCLNDHASINLPAMKEREAKERIGRIWSALQHKGLSVVGHWNGGVWVVEKNVLACGNEVRKKKKTAMDGYFSPSRVLYPHKLRQWSAC